MNVAMNHATTLRDYQSELIKEVRNAYQSGCKVGTPVLPKTDARIGAVIQYKRPIGPVAGFFKVAPSRALIQLAIKRYRAIGWTYFVEFKDVNGYGLSAGR